MKTVIIKRADGGVSIMPLDQEFDAIFALAPVAQIVEHEIRQWQSQASPQWLPITWRVVDGDARLPDRTFRNALVDNGTTLVHDMPKARDIWRDKMREARQPLLETLDVALMRNLEAGMDSTAVVSQKQALRDVTADPAIEAAKSPEDLKKVWPAVLTKS